MVQRILSHRLQLLRMVMMSGLRAVVMVLTLCLAALHTLWSPRANRERGRIVRCPGETTAICVEVGGRECCPVGLGVFSEVFLRHGEAIRDGPGRSNDLRTQRAGSRRVHKAGVPRMLYAMYDGGLAVVAVGQGRFAFKSALRGGVASGDDHHGRLGSRRDGASRGRESTSACYRGFARGGDRGDCGRVWMVRQVPGMLSCLRQWGSSYKGASC